MTALRELLARVVKLAGIGRLIPRNKRYIAQLDTSKCQTHKARILNAHTVSRASATAMAIAT